MEFTYSNVCFYIIEQKGNPLSVIDNWGALHKDKNGQWINDVARDKYVSHSRTYHLCHFKGDGDLKKNQI